MLKNNKIKNKNITNNINILEESITNKVKLFMKDDYYKFIEYLLKVYENESILYTDYDLIDQFINNKIIEKDEYSSLKNVFINLFDITEEIASYSKMLFSKSTTGSLYPSPTYSAMIEELKKNDQLSFLCILNSPYVDDSDPVLVKEIEDFADEDIFGIKKLINDGYFKDDLFGETYINNNE